MLQKIIDYQEKNIDGTLSGQSVRCSFDEMRELSKRQIESFEHWSRRLIDEFFRTDYGTGYLDKEIKNNLGQPLVKEEIKKRIRARKLDNPGRYPRDIDALLLDDLEYFYTREDLYREYYKPVFEPFFSGREEIRCLLNRLIPIRNKLYHDNPISIREAEKVLCYTNDFIDVFQEYYLRSGKNQDFNVPVILELTDSQGNRVHRTKTQYSWQVFNMTREQIEKSSGIESNAITTNHRSGDHYEVELVVDSSFPQGSYRIEWEIDVHRKIIKGEGKTIAFDFTDEMVSMEPTIEAKLITNKNWHRFANIDCDDKVEIHLSTVLPPIEDTY